MSRAFKLLSFLLVLVTGCATTPQGTRIEHETSYSSRLAHLLSGSPAMPGRRPPDVVLSNLKGEDIHLKQFLGKQPTILLFSSAACPYSSQQHIEVENAMKRLGKGAQVVTILVKETPGSAREYLSTHQVPGTVLLDTRGQAASTYKIELVPTVLLINSGGYVNHFGHFTPESEVVSLMTNLRRGELTIGGTGGRGRG